MKIQSTERVVRRVGDTVNITYKLSVPQGFTDIPSRTDKLTFHRPKRNFRVRNISELYCFE